MVELLHSDTSKINLKVLDLFVERGLIYDLESFAIIVIARRHIFIVKEHLKWLKLGLNFGWLDIHGCVLDTV